MVAWPTALLHSFRCIFLCIFRAKFEEVIVFCYFYSLPSLLPWTYSYGTFTPSTPSKPCSFWSPANCTLLNPRACLNPYELNHWAQFTKPSYLPHYLLSGSVTLAFWLFLFSLLFPPPESEFPTLCTNDILSQIIFYCWGSSCEL